MADLTFNPPDPQPFEPFPPSPHAIDTTMNTTALMNLIVELQREVKSLREQTQQPRTSISDVSMNTAPPSPKKPKIKDVQCRKFDGAELYPSLGAGFEYFLKEYEHAIHTESLVNGPTWSDELKASVLVNFLDGKASRYYHKKCAEWKHKHSGNSMSFAQLKSTMLSEFGCRLTQLELSDRIKCYKRGGDTWSDYLEYLKFIEGLMDGDQSLLLLQVFCSNSCPEIAPVLLSSVDIGSADKIEEADKALNLLYRLQGDGRGYAAVRRQPTTKWEGKPQRPSHQRNKTNFHESVARPQEGEGNAASTHRPPLKCYICSQGHKMIACPLVAKAKELSQGAAHAAESADSRDDNSDTDGEGEIWIASGRNEPKLFPKPSVNEPRCTWLVDSGATHHMCGDRSILFGVEPTRLVIRVANGERILASEKGNCIITTVVNKRPKAILLTDVYFAPGLSRNLISVHKLVENGLVCVFGSSCTITNSSGDTVGTASSDGSLWKLNSTSGLAEANFAQVREATLQKWHERLGHINYQDLLRMVDKGLVDGLRLSNRKAQFCLSCSEAKQSRRSQPEMDTSASAPTDVVGATIGMDLKTDLTPDRNGHIHILTMIDYGSSFNRIHLLRRKGEAADHIRAFIHEFETQYKLKVQCVRTDGGGEFISGSLKGFFRERGIRHQHSEASTSASNGKAERFHRTLMDSARAMLWATNLPKRFWGDAARYASYIRNRLPTRGNPDYKTPLEALTGQVPDVSHILKFGSKCTAHIKHKAGRSLMKRAEKAVILGISEVQKGYILYLPRTKKVLTTTHVQNVDRIDPRDTSCLLDDIADAADKDAETPGPVVVHSSAPAVTPTTSESKINSSLDNPNGHGEIDAPSDGEHEDFGHEISAHRLRSIFGGSRNRPLPQEEFKLPDSFIKEFAQPASLLLTIGLSASTSLARGSQATGQIKEPRSYAEAMSGPQCAEWRKAIEEELKAIADNGTWETIEPPKGSAMITGKWVFKVKFNSRGDLERFKARLVARGFTQRYGIDFSETFSPVLKMSSLRFLFVLAAIWHVQVRQGDVPNAYLKADIDKPIVMRAPPGMQLPKGKHLLLKKSLYGLKQSGRLWNELMHKFLTAHGLQQSKLDPCLYFCRKGNKLLVLGLYVDDLLIVSQDPDHCDWIMRELQKEFKVKDLGIAAKCLGLQVDQVSSGIFIYQHANIMELLERTGMSECRPTKTPMAGRLDSSDDGNEPFTDTQLMRETIGSLLWISNCTRPDITMAVNFLARHVSQPTTKHWQAVKHLLRYLKGTADTGLSYQYRNDSHEQCNPVMYTDADWAGDQNDAKSTSGGILLLNGMPVAWYSKKQTTVALSTAEAEYIAGGTAIRDCLWIRQLLDELGLRDLVNPVTLRVDNQSAIKTMENALTTSRMRHINIQYHFIRDVLKKGSVCVEYCPTTSMKADILTKPLGSQLHQRMAQALHLAPHSLCMGRGGVLEDGPTDENATVPSSQHVPSSGVSQPPQEPKDT